MTNSEYVRIVEDTALISGWVLGEPTAPSGAVDPRRFTRARRYDGSIPLSIPVKRQGMPLAFSFGPFSMPVVSGPVADVLRSQCTEEVQLLPASINALAPEYFVLNVLEVIACVDDAASKVQRWAAADGRPDKVGQYRMIEKLVLNANCLGQQPGIFRLAGWNVAMIARGDIWSALERIPAAGAKAVPLTITRPLRTVRVSNRVERP